MPRAHATFCDLSNRADHGRFCVSRPVAREAVVVTEAGDRADLTVDLIVDREDPLAARLVRLIAEPPAIDERFVAVMTSGSARQVAAALLVAAEQAEELDRDLASGCRSNAAAATS